MCAVFSTGVYVVCLCACGMVLRGEILVHVVWCLSVCGVVFVCGVFMRVMWCLCHICMCSVVFVCVCGVVSVSYTHLTLPTSGRV